MDTSNEKVIIEVDYSYHWRCPSCGGYNDIKKDGDGFCPVICWKCETEFPNYEENN